jgi:type I restriction enzyme S subunit
VNIPIVHVGELALNDSGAFKIGPFGSSLKKTELVESGIPVAGIENVLPNKFVKGFRRFITARKFEELSDYEILPDDVLVTTMGTIGRAASAPPDLGRVIFDSHLFRMRVDTSRVFPPYLCYALNSDLVASQLARMARGAIMEGLNTTILRECSIPLPEISEQQRIAGRLEQAAQLVRTRVYAIELTDRFLPAAFLELFGDPKQNPNEWPEQTFSDVCSKFSDGPFGSNLKSSDYRSSGVRVVRLQNIGVGEFLDDDKAFVAKEHFAALQKHTCVPGDVLVGTMGDPNLRACIQPTHIPIALNKADCIQARPDPKHLNALYLRCLLNIPSTLHLVPGMVHGQTRARVSMGELARLPIPVPPIQLQQEFAALVERVERLRAVQREALRQADHLFQTLLHRAFSETDSSKTAKIEVVA